MPRTKPSPVPMCSATLPQTPGMCKKGFSTTPASGTCFLGIGWSWQGTTRPPSAAPGRAGDFGPHRAIQLLHVNAFTRKAISGRGLACWRWLLSCLKSQGRLILRIKIPGFKCRLPQGFTFFVSLSSAAPLRPPQRLRYLHI